jgi:RNA polymerase sigma factor (TIGR02999 family)
MLRQRFVNELPMSTPMPPDPGSADEQGVLFASLYQELRRMAQRELKRGAGVSLSATTLLHETYFKVKERSESAFPDEPRFLAYAARAMRTLVIDYARSRQAQKRGGGFEITGLPTEMPHQATEAIELEQLGAAIDALAERDRELAQLVDLKFFCGYSLIEIARMRGVSERTAQRDWDKARILLKSVLEGGGALPE